MRAALFLCAVAALHGATPDAWLRRVEPIASKAEKQRYLELRDEREREAYRTHFWDDKGIAPEEYFRRMNFIDTEYGSGQPGSGANTDQGRLYLSMGPPMSIERLPSSRIFVPIEIWFYDGAKPLGINTRLQFLFFRPNQSIVYKLYSPQLHTLRALLVPNSATRGMFPVNDIITRDDIINRLNVPPAEQDIVDAALRVAPGITGSGNDEILFYAVTPSAMLQRDVKTKVSSRFNVASRPEVTTFTTWTADGIAVVDVSVRATARARIAVEVQSAGNTVERGESGLPFESTRAVGFVYRAHLLPGTYSLMVEIDGARTPFPLEVPAKRIASQLLLGAVDNVGSRTATPFRFGAYHVAPDEASVALLQLPAPMPLAWHIFENGRAARTVKTAAADVDAAGFVVLPLEGVVPKQGNWRIEVETADGVRSAAAPRPGGDRTWISYNANLVPGIAWLSVGRQHLQAGRLIQARDCFQKAEAAGPSNDLDIAVAGLDLMQGRLDEARARLEKVLGRDPQNFSALAARGYVERAFQDNVAATRFFERALKVREDAAVRAALAGVKDR